MAIKIDNSEFRTPTISVAQELLLKNQLAIMIALFGSPAVSDKGGAEALRERIVLTFEAFGIDPSGKSGTMQ